MEIRKIKLGKTLNVDVTYIDKDGNKVTFKGQNKCHIDLYNALKELVPYLALYTEQKEANRIDWDDLYGEANAILLHNLAVTGISVSGDEDHKLVVLTGERRLKTKQNVSFNSAIIEISADSANSNEYITSFHSAVNKLVREAKLYVQQRKWDVDDYIAESHDFEESYYDRERD